MHTTSMSAMSCIRNPTVENMENIFLEHKTKKKTCLSNIVLENKALEIYENIYQCIWLATFDILSHNPLCSPIQCLAICKFSLHEVLGKPGLRAFSQFGLLRFLQPFLTQEDLMTVTYIVITIWLDYSKTICIGVTLKMIECLITMLWTALVVSRFLSVIKEVAF